MRKRFGTRRDCAHAPVDLDAYMESIQGITVEIRDKQYDLHKWNSRQMPKKVAEINRLKLIRSQIQSHIEKQFAYPQSNQQIVNTHYCG